MAALTGLTVIKKFSYRGDSNERWSNTYWFTGDVPANPTEWRALFDALVAQEKTLYSVNVNVVGGYGYDSNADGAHAVWSVDLTVSPNVIVPGTGSGTGGANVSGDVASWVRWKLDKTSSKGKPVYLRKYYHGILCNSTQAEQLSAALITAHTNFGGKMRDGTFLSARTICDRVDPSVAVIGSGVSTWLTTRTLKRRGKRP